MGAITDGGLLYTPSVVITDLPISPSSFVTQIPTDLQLTIWVVSRTVADCSETTMHRIRL